MTLSHQMVRLFFVEQLYRGYSILNNGLSSRIMKLVFATNNLNKLSEIQSLVPKEIEILSLKDIDCNEELPETKFTLEGNALEKPHMFLRTMDITVLQMIRDWK